MRYDTELAPAIVPPRARPDGRNDPPALFNEQSLDAYRSGMQRCVELVRHTLTRARNPCSGIEPHELQPAFQAIDLDRPLDDLEASLEELQRLYLDHAVYFHHPRYVAHLNCPITLPSILAEAIATPLNTAVETWDQSAGATLIEQKLIDWTAARVGLGEDADGVFTSGGTQSNLMALSIARDSACEAMPGHAGNRHHGLPPNFRQLRILTSEVSHFSVQKAAALLGLGYDAVIAVPSDASKRMDIAALQTALKACDEAGLIPFAIVATAGTTDFGSIDPIPTMAELCRQRGIWLHVDAAYGGGLLLSRRHRHWLAGIEQADSVSIDYHKTFFQPVSCSACLVRDRRQLRHVTYHADYLNPRDQAEGGTPDLVNKSLQTTRRFDALKLWMTLRTLGAERLGDHLDQVIELAQQAYRAMRQRDDIEVLLPPALSTLVFRYRPDGVDDDGDLDTLNQQIRQTLSRRGEAVVAGTRVDGRFHLKFTLLNPMTRLEELVALVAEIARIGESLAASLASSSARPSPVWSQSSC
ncbi:MAG: pyridoxal-dependent decarboxylase [Salinicola sp.]|uniref:pyridoxal phosphate-dependent decarboxylase family protein n=1 Tax=uncultured Salinicola sp. TaxID=1193542 RepID=UPI000C8CF90E|nr:aspartate aminotransferase family protein [uncultured Salinicola sp.]MAM58112.1 pyridoxal-dependent decarboxylase [Salinicola sp.]